MRHGKTGQAVQRRPERKQRLFRRRNIQQPRSEAVGRIGIAGEIVAHRCKSEKPDRSQPVTVFHKERETVCTTFRAAAGFFDRVQKPDLKRIDRKGLQLVFPEPVIRNHADAQRHHAHQIGQRSRGRRQRAGRIGKHHQPSVGGIFQDHRIIFGPVSGKIRLDHDQSTQRPQNLALFRQTAGPETDWNQPAVQETVFLESARRRSVVIENADRAGIVIGESYGALVHRGIRTTHPVFEHTEGVFIIIGRENRKTMDRGGSGRNNHFRTVAVQSRPIARTQPDHHPVRTGIRIGDPAFEFRRTADRQLKGITQQDLSLGDLHCRTQRQIRQQQRGRHYCNFFQSRKHSCSI